MKITPETQAVAQNTLDYINAHPKQHDQSIFWMETQCGTSMCIAGTALFLEYGIQSMTDFVYNPQAKQHEGIAAAAGPLLGLEDDEEYDKIFFEYNNDAAIRQLTHLANGDAAAFMAHTNTEDEDIDE